MHLTVNGQVYYFVWKYIESGTKFGIRKTTHLQLKLGDQIVKDVFAFTNPKDTFSRSKGRLVTIAKLLDKWGLDKSSRKEVYTQYFKISKV